MANTIQLTDSKPEPKLNLCIYCQHFYMWEAEQEWSEVTPGSDLEIGCAKGHWRVNNYSITTQQYRGYLEMANTCKDVSVLLRSWLQTH